MTELFPSVFAHLFDGLVRRFGGVEAAAALLEARLGAGSKGTVSKMCTGQAAVTLPAVLALEDALGSFPITGLLAERIGARARLSDDTVQAALARSTVESAEAHSAVIRAFRLLDRGPDLTADERAAAIAETVEAVEALEVLLRALREQK